MTTTPILIDFGIARGAEQTRMTQTGTTIGSWHYMAPERFRAGEVDARADVYALTCVLYECLTGTPPFPGDTLESQVAGHLTDPPPRPSATRPAVPTGFDEVIAKGMAKKLDDRYTDARELASSTRAALDDPAMQKISSAPTGLWPSQTQIKRTSSRTHTTKRSFWVGVAIAAVLTLSVALVVGDQLLSGPSGAKAPQVSSSQPNPNTSVGAHGSVATAEGASYSAEVVSFTQIGDSLSVQLRNPNRDVGLVRSPFELAMIDKAGAVIATAGQDGLPGTEAGTIYQLPPLGQYGLSGIQVPQGKTVASVELTITGKWLQWNTVDAPTVALTDEALGPDSGFSGPTVTGRVVLNSDGPQNIIVLAFVKTPPGTVVSHVFVDCAQPGQRRTFEAQSFDDVRGPYELESVVAYPTSVKGAGPQYTPTC